jgi:hypothetical protein
MPGLFDPMRAESIPLRKRIVTAALPRACAGYTGYPMPS